MNNSEKKYGYLGYILATAMLAELISKDFSTNDTEPDETNEKPVKENNVCHGNCKNNCKSYGENNSEINMNKVKTAYKDWFPRMCEYGFTEGEDFSSFLSESPGEGYENLRRSRQTLNRIIKRSTHSVIDFVRRFSFIH